MSSNDGFMCDTPAAIDFFRLASMKGRVRLESRGMKSRGFSARKVMALEMGLKASAKYDEVIAAIDKELAKRGPEASKGITRIPGPSSNV